LEVSVAAIDSSKNLKSMTASCKHGRRAHPHESQYDIAERLRRAFAIAYRRVLVRASYVVLICTILMVIVQYDVQLTGWIPPPALPKIGITCVLPYGVSTYSIVSLDERLKITRDDVHD